MPLATTKKTVARWEHGVVPDRQTQYLIADVLSIPDRYVDTHVWPAWVFIDGTGDIDAATWDAAGAINALGHAVTGAALDRRTMLGRLGATLAIPVIRAFSGSGIDLPDATGAIRVGNDVTSNLFASLVTLRRLGDQLGGGATQATVLSNLDLIIAILRDGRYATHVGIELHRLAAGFAQLAGFNAVDMGYQAAAQNLYIASLHASTVARDHELGVYTLSWMSYQAYATANGADAMALVEIPQVRGWSCTSPGVRAILCARGALGAAQVRDRYQFRRLIRTAEGLHRKDDGTNVTDWFNEVEMQGAIARGLHDLGDYLQAEHLLRGMLKDSRMSGNPRSEGVYRARLAASLAHRRSFDDAISEATIAADFAKGLNSQRITEMVRDVAAILPDSRSDGKAKLEALLSSH